jgi:Glycosyltransferase
LPDQFISISAVPHEQVPSYIRTLDIFVLPSLSTPTWVEQFGIVLAQAMLAGVPCVGSSSGAIPDVIGPGGVIFIEGDAKMLSSELRRLIDSAVERSIFGEQARAYAMEHYTQRAVATAYLTAFKSNRTINQSRW